jgi:hypothetical protein
MVAHALEGTMQRKRPGNAISGSARVCQAEEFGFQTSQRSETAAAWLVSGALVLAISLFAAEVLLQSRMLH